MESYSRDLLGGFGAGGDEPSRGEQEKRSDMETEEVELSLGLSLGGRFGLDRKSGGERLARSSSVASILAAEEVALAPPALARTSSLPTMADVEAEKKQSLGDWTGWRGNAVGVESSVRAPVPRSAGHGSGVEELPSLKQLASIMNAGNDLEMDPVAKLPVSGSPSSGSSDGEGKKLEVNTPETLMRTSSLPAFPAGIEDELRKRKEAQTLKRLEVKKKRIERRNSSTVSKEAAGQMLEDMNAGAEKVESSDDISMQNKQIGGSGLPPPYQATFTSKGNSSSAMPKWQNSSVKGTPSGENQSLSSAVPPLAEGSNGALPAEGASSTVIASPSSALAVIATALGPRGEQLLVSGRRSVRAKSMGDVERMMMQEMPCVCTNGLPNGRRVEGFLYKYRKAEEVRIVCLCHGSFLTPADFVKHAGGGHVANPLRHIIVNPSPPSF